MKKTFAFSSLFAAAAGILGALLRQWHLSAGVDDRGLFPAAHPGWIGYVVLSLAAVAALWLVTRQAEAATGWKRNFPHDLSDRSSPRFYWNFAKAAFRAAGYALAAAGIASYTNSALPGTDILHTVAYWGGFACAVALLILSVQLIMGKTPTAILFLIPCVYFAVLLFKTSHQFRGEPELMRFLPQAAALAFSALSTYQLWGFAVGWGDRRKSLFWSLSAGMLCLAALPGAQPMYGALGLWHLLAHCALTLPPEEITEECPESAEESSEE